MNPARFPPLPPETRLRALAAESRPEPMLEVRNEPPGRGAWTGVGCLGLYLLFCFVLMCVGTAFNVWERKWEDVLGGLACSSVSVGVVGWLGWTTLRERGSWWLRATPAAVRAERVVWNREEVAEVDLHADLTDGPPPLTSGGRLHEPAGGPLRLGGTDLLAPPGQQSADAEWLRVALARVGAARPSPPLFRAVDPPRGEPATHPEVRVGRTPGRTEIEFPASRRSVRWKLGYALLVLLAAAAFVAYAIVARDELGDGLARFLWCLTALIVAVAAVAALIPWQTRRITIAHGRVRVGTGRAFAGRSVRLDRLAAVAVDGPRPLGEGQEVGAPAVWLVPTRRERRRLRLADRAVVPGGWRAVTGHVGTGGDAERFARAVAEQTAAALHAAGWRPAPPVDWRFGWRDPAPPPERP